MAGAGAASSDSSDAEKDHKESQKQLVNGYQRDKIANLFSEQGSGPKSCSKIFIKYSKMDEAAVADFLHPRAHVSQRNVEEEVTASEYQTMDKWANFFKEHELHSKCGSELPLLLRAIALTEPAPECKDEIDFKKLYLWLADVMVGNAPPELNAQSQLFLVENYKNLLAAANAPGSERELMDISKAVVNKVENKFSPFGKGKDVNFVKSVNPLELSIKKE